MTLLRLFVRVCALVWAVVAVASAFVQPSFGQARPQARQRAAKVPPAQERLDAAVSKLMDSAIAAKAFPSAVVGVMQNGKVLLHKAYGRLRYEATAPRTDTTTLYDLASLTKVLCTTTCLMRLVGEQRVNLDEPVSRYIPEFAVRGKSGITVRHLLLHNSGFVPFRPVPPQMNTTDEFLSFVLTDTVKVRAGDTTMYSDLGFITLGELVRRVTGKRLDAYFAETFAKPMGLSTLRFFPTEESDQEALKRLAGNIAPVEADTFWTWKKNRALVHDPRAAFTDGVSGHAGLFGAASDVLKLMQMLTSGGTYNGKRYLESAVIAAFTKRAFGASSRALGWDTRVEGERTSAGTLFSAGSFGHTGFTGTSVWFDPERKLCVVLLTNRVFPTAENKQIIQIRPLFHNAVVTALTR